MILLLLTYLLKKFGHKLKFNTLFQKSRFLMTLQPIAIPKTMALELLKPKDV